MRGLSRSRSGDSSTPCDALRNWLAEHPEILTLSVFSPLPDEPDLTEIVRSHTSRIWTYPRVTGDTLEFHRVRDPDHELQPGRFGIREPLPGSTSVAPETIDAFLCPGMAFDLRGGRLGRGKGYYDRILSRARPDALRIGICFPDQIVADTFSEPHDVAMHRVLF